MSSPIPIEPLGPKSVPLTSEDLQQPHAAPWVQSSLSGLVAQKFSLEHKRGPALGTAGKVVAPGPEQSNPGSLLEPSPAILLSKQPADGMLCFSNSCYGHRLRLEAIRTLNSSG